MTNLDLCGAVALGAFVGFVIRFFIERFEEFTTKSLSGILPVALGGVVAGVVLKFGQHGFAAYSLGLVLGLFVYQALYSKFPRLPMRRASTGPFVALEVVNRITMLDTSGAEATWMRWQKMKFNREVSEILITQITMDGNAADASLSAGNRVAELVIKKRAGQTLYYARFTAPIKKGELAELTFSLKLHNAFLEAVESLEHHVMQETEKLIFELEFKPERTCKAIQLYSIFGSQTNPLSTFQPSLLVKETVPGQLRVEESYRLEWSW